MNYCGSSAIKLEANIITLKVGGQTNPISLKTAICGHIKDGSIVYLDAIGVAANYVATKAVIMARGQLATMGMELNSSQIFHDLEIKDPKDKETKTAIRWIIRP